MKPKEKQARADRPESYRLTLRNDQHDTTYTIHLGKALPSTIGIKQAMSCRVALVGVGFPSYGFTCRAMSFDPPDSRPGPLGESGPQDLPLNISENPDGSVSIRRS